MANRGSSIKKNYVYQVLYQALVSLLPFITSPYVSRILGAEGVGVYSYTYTIALYFTTLGNLGISQYGNRIIAQTRDDKEKMCRTFTSLYCFHVCVFALVIVAYIIFINFFAEHEYKELFCIQVLYLLGGLLDISWLYYGFEDFKLTVSRSAIIKLLSVFAIFFFVKSEDDLWVYILIMALGYFLNIVVLWCFFKKYAHFAKFSIKEFTQHFKPLMLLFFSVVAYSIYSYMDKIMIGAISSTAELGYYENAWKMIEFPVAFVTSLGTVMLPRISNLQTKGDEGTIYRYIKKTLHFSVIFASAIAFGIAAIAGDFSVVFWGKSFSRSGLLIEIMALTIILMSWNGVVRQEYLIPYKKDMQYLTAVCTGAVLNVIFNLILIPFYGAAGAAIGTVIAYFGIFSVQNAFAWRKLNISKLLKQTVPYLLIGIAMFVVVSIYSTYHTTSIINLIIEIIIGGVTFITLSLAYAYSFKDSDFTSILDSALTKFHIK
ncbi:MAG: flippase [Lachnospiraceae bacterium]|nr:flippase [Lachnospiraceae bacterium]